MSGLSAEARRRIKQLTEAVYVTVGSPIRHESPSHLPEDVRAQQIEALEEVVIDGLDLYLQLKQAHWNIKGTYFTVFHPLFDTIAASVVGANDQIAERAVQLGAHLRTDRDALADHSRLPKFPSEVFRDLQLVEIVQGFLDEYRRGLEDARKLSEGLEDLDTLDMLTEIASTFEKHAWFLVSTLETQPR